MLRRTCLVFALLIGVAPLMAAPAVATPHGEQEDGCDHGSSTQPCRPDPSVNGKDCAAHGNHGGENEDHCLTTTSTTASTSTTTSTSLPATTGTTTATALTTTSSVPVSVTPNLGCVTSSGHPYLTNIEQGGCAGPVAEVLTQHTSERRAALPTTGLDAGLLFVIGTAVLMAGLSCWFCGRAIE